MSEKKIGALFKWNKNIYNFTPNPHLTKIFIEFFNFLGFSSFWISVFLSYVCEYWSIPSYATETLERINN